MKYQYIPSKYTSSKKFSVEDIEKWAELYDSGTSSTEIAKMYKTSGNNVIARLRKLGVPIRTRSQVKMGSMNPNWVGDKVKYFPLHKWVKSRLPKTKLCQMCGKVPPLDLANKGVYNRDLDNWEWLCRKCHMTSDGRLNNLKQYASNRTLVKD